MRYVAKRFTVELTSPAYRDGYDRISWSSHGASESHNDPESPILDRNTCFCRAWDAQGGNRREQCAIVSHAAPDCNSVPDGADPK